MVCEYIQNCMKFSIKLVFTKFFTLEAEAGESLEFEAKLEFGYRESSRTAKLVAFLEKSNKKVIF